MSLLLRIDLDTIISTDGLQDLWYFCLSLMEIFSVYFELMSKKK